MQRPETNEKEGCNPGISEGTTSSNRVCVGIKKQYPRPGTSKLLGTRSLKGLKTLKLFDRDLDFKTCTNLQQQEYIAIDTETDGLDYRKDKLRMIQFGTEDGRAYIVRNPDHTSFNVDFVLQSEKVQKVFHHAMFDLRMIKAWTHYEVAGPIECTKILTKICYPERKSGIGSVIEHTLGFKPPNIKVDYNKWNIPTLTPDQLIYAAADVIYLVKAFKRLIKESSWHNYNIYKEAMQVCIHMAALQVEGFQDLFDYKQDAYQTTKENRDWWEAHCGGSTRRRFR